MNLLDSFKDIGGMGVGGVIGAGVVWLSKAVAEYLKDDNKSKNELKKAEIEKGPDYEREWKDGMVALMKELRQDLSYCRETIDEQSEKINSQSVEISSLRDEVADLNDHIDNLTGVLKANNIAPPPRRKRAAHTENSD